MCVRHPWDQYARHVLSHSNPHLVSALLKTRLLQAEADEDVNEQERSVVKESLAQWQDYLEFSAKKNRK